MGIYREETVRFVRDKYPKMDPASAADQVGHIRDLAVRSLTAADRYANYMEPSRYQDQHLADIAVPRLAVVRSWLIHLFELDEDRVMGGVYYYRRSFLDGSRSHLAKAIDQLHGFLGHEQVNGGEAMSDEGIAYVQGRMTVAASLVNMAASGIAKYTGISVEAAHLHYMYPTQYPMPAVVTSQDRAAGLDASLPPHVIAALEDAQLSM